jgi:hypothetical protein
MQNLLAGLKIGSRGGHLPYPPAASPAKTLLQRFNTHFHSGQPAAPRRRGFFAWRRPRLPAAKHCLPFPFRCNTRR